MSEIIQKPSVGRIVHYYRWSGQGPFAAIVTGISKGDPFKIDLTIFWDDGTLGFGQGIKPNEQGEYWRWPTKV